MPDDNKPGFFKKLKSKLGSGAGKAAVGGAAVGGAVVGAVGATAMGVGRAGARGIMALRGQFTVFFLLIATAAHALFLRNGGNAPAFGGWFVVYIMLAVFATFIFYRDPNTPLLRQLGSFLLLTMFAYWLPWLLLRFGVPFAQSMSPEISGSLVAFVKLCAMFTPVWPVYILLNPGDWITNILAKAYVLGITLAIIFSSILPLISNSGMQYSAPVLAPGELWSEAKALYRTVTSKTIEAGEAIVQEGTDVVKGNLEKTAPELFVGQVDQSEGLPLGVRHTDGRPLFDTFRVDLGDNIVTSTTVRSRTLNEERTTIEHECYLQSYGTSLSAKKVATQKRPASPATTSFIYSGDQEDAWTVECIVPKSDVATFESTTSRMSAEMIMNSTFDFSTSGYMTYAFMDRNLHASLRLDNRDPAREMGLQSSRQIARYTPGPVSIGMPTETIPFPYDATVASSLPSFGVTFANAQIGRGGIREFTSFTVFLPAQFAFDTKDGSCTPNDVKVVRKGVSSTMGEGYVEYAFSNVKPQGRDGTITVRCPLTLSGTGPVLGPTGTAIYTVLVVADYTYSVYSATPVSLIVTPVQTSSQLGIGAPNLNTATDANACRSTTPTCTRPGDNGMCTCYFIKKVNGIPEKTLSGLQWDRFTNDQFASFDDAKPLLSTNIPSICAEGRTNCNADGVCRCLEYQNNIPGVYTWDVRSFTGATVWNACSKNENTGVYSCD